MRDCCSSSLGGTLCVTTRSHERTRETTRSLLQSRRFTVAVSACARFLFLSANYIVIGDGRQAFLNKVLRHTNCASDHTYFVFQAGGSSPGIQSTTFFCYHNLKGSSDTNFASAVCKPKPKCVGATIKTFDAGVGPRAHCSTTWCRGTVARQPPARSRGKYLWGCHCVTVCVCASVHVWVCGDCLCECVCVCV